MLLAAALVLSACSHDLAPTVGAAPDTTASPGFVRWSDKRSWPDGAVPAAGADVVIPEGTRVELDVSPAAIGLLTIRGELTVAPGRGDIELKAQRIDVYGRLTVGAETKPFTSRFTMTLSEHPGDALGKGIVVFSGGNLDLFGEPRTMWTRLAANAPAGATQLVLETATGWRAGDRIALASTSDRPSEAELLQVQSVNGTTVALQTPLRYAHRGDLMTVSGVRVDERAEVGLLTHNLKVQGDDASEATQYGSHVIVFKGGSAHIDGVEFYRAGQWGHMARYPFHWHMAGSVPGQFARRSSVWHSYNRCMTVHGTHDALVEDNVCYDHAGHGYFIEDGNEHGNTLRNNLGMFDRVGSLLPSDQRPATFWITNPDNTFEGNVAAGSRDFGFWISAPLHPTGPSATDTIWPLHTPLRRFAGNVAHSNGSDGLSIEEDGSTYGSYNIDYRPRAGGDPNGAPVMAVVQDFTAWRNNRGVWVRGDHVMLQGGLFSSNTFAVHIGDASLHSESVVSGTTIIGETPSGRVRGSPMLGVLVYDGPVATQGVRFINFPGDKGGAFGPVPGFAGEQSARNDATGVSFDNAQPFYLAPALKYNGEKTTTLRDLDGSVSGVVGGTVIPDSALFGDATCTRRPDWRAQVCARSYVHVRFSDRATLAPAVLRREDGATATFGSYNTQLVTLNAPTRHEYSLEPTAFNGGAYNLLVQALPAGEWITLSAPWTNGAVRPLFPSASPTPVPMAASRAELDAASETTAWFDAAKHRLYVRFVGRSGLSDVGVMVLPAP